MENQATESPLRFHPFHVILVLFLVAVTTMFLTFTAAYAYTRLRMGMASIPVPLVFVLNTFILMGSSYALWRAQQAYKADQTEAYKHALLATIILSILFLGGQIMGWQQLFQEQVFLSSSTAGSYLYILSGTHFLHLLAGIPFLIHFYRQAQRHMVEPVSVMIYFADRNKRLQLQLLSVYWHFLDALWIYLVIFLAVNEWIH